MAVRISKQLVAEIRSVAKAENRTVRGQIEVLLRTALAQQQEQANV